MPFFCLDRRDIATLVQLGFAYHELCDFSQALAIYKKVVGGIHVFLRSPILRNFDYVCMYYVIMGEFFYCASASDAKDEDLLWCTSRVTCTVCALVGTTGPLGPFSTARYIPR